MAEIETAAGEGGGDARRVRREPSNIMYCVRTVKNRPGEEDTFLVGAEDTHVTKIRHDYDRCEKLDTFTGHSMGIRSIELSRDGKKLLTGCEDHSLRIWDYEEAKSKCILAGHRDVVVSTLYNLS